MSTVTVQNGSVTISTLQFYFYMHRIVNYLLF